ncbi:MAG: hypothetical protein VX589_18250 [Myxococcota bacterium]|nr:hypothetical protein [Myxococcota bacterium]
MRIFNSSGAIQAYPVFRASIEDPACVSSVVLLLNYGRIIERIVDAQGDRPKTCEAVEVYRRVMAAPNVSDDIKRLGRSGLEKLGPRCEAYVQRQGVEDYDRIIGRAEALRGAGRLHVAALDYATAYRLNRGRREAPQALCEILPRIGRVNDAARFCRSATPTIHAAPATDDIVSVEPLSSSDNTKAWVFGIAAVTTAMAGGVTFMIANRRADDAWVARRSAEQALSVGDLVTRDAQRDAMEDHRSAARKLEIAAWSFGGTGAILAGIAVYSALNQGTDRSVQVGFSFSGAAVLFDW